MGDSTPIADDRVQIYCSSAVRGLVKAQKRGGETYDDVLRKMVSQYDPELGYVGGSKEQQVKGQEQGPGQW